MTEGFPHSEARLASALAAITDAVLIADAQGELIIFNDAFVRFLRCASRDEVRAAMANRLSFLESRFADGSIATPDMWAVPRALKGETASGEIYRMRRKDTGEEWIASFSFAPVRQDDGTVEGAVLISRDITDQVAFEEQLRMVNQRADAHYQNSPLAVIEFDPQFRVTRWSDEAVRMFGYERDEIIGKAIGDIRWVYEPDIPRVQEETQGFLDGSRTRSKNVNRNYRKDGSVINCEWYSSAIYDAEGKLASVLSLVLDVTERTSLLKALTDSEQRANDLIRYAPTGICTVDLIGRRFTEVNDAMVQMTGYSRRELLSMDPLHLMDGPSRDLMRAQVWRSAAGHPHDDTVEYRVTCKDGSELFMVMHFRVQTDEQGRPLSVFIVGHDVTERRRNEDARARLLEEERTAARLHESLTRIDEMIHSSFDRQRAFEGILPDASEALGADSAAVALRHDRAWVLHEVHRLPSALVGHEFMGEGNPVTNAAFATGQPVMIDDVRTAPMVYEETQRLFGSTATMLVPVTVRGEAIALVIFNFTDPHRFGDQERSFASRLSSSLGLALANIELFESEREIAETLQETLLVVPTHITGIRFSRSYHSATAEKGRVGGDFIDVFEGHGHLVGISLGDVSGKGIDAAVTTSLIRTTLRVHAIDGQPPAMVAAKANDVIHRFTDVGVYVTLWFGLLDTRTGLLRYVCAGHPQGLVLSQSGEIRELPCRDAILGAFEDTTYLECQTVLEKGDRLILYSDGVTEARSPSGAFLDTTGLLDILRRRGSVETGALSDAVMEDVFAFSEGLLRDDAAILAVEPVRLRVRPGDDSRQLEAFPGEGPTEP